MSTQTNQQFSGANETGISMNSSYASQYALQLVMQLLPEVAAKNNQIKEKIMGVQNDAATTIAKAGFKMAYWIRTGATIAAFGKLAEGLGYMHGARQLGGASSDLKKADNEFKTERDKINDEIKPLEKAQNSGNTIDPLGKGVSAPEGLREGVTFKGEEKNRKGGEPKAVDNRAKIAEKQKKLEDLKMDHETKKSALNSKHNAAQQLGNSIAALGNVPTQIGQGFTEAEKARLQAVEELAKNQYNTDDRSIQATDTTSSKVLDVDPIQCLVILSRRG